MKITRVERNHLGTILTTAAILFLLVLVLVLPLSSKTVTVDKEVIVTEEVSEIQEKDVDLSSVDFQLSALTEQIENDTHIYKTYSLNTEDNMTGCFVFEYTFSNRSESLTTCLNNGSQKNITFIEEKSGYHRYSFLLTKTPDITKFEEVTVIKNKTTIVQETKVVSTSILDDF